MAQDGGGDGYQGSAGMKMAEMHMLTSRLTTSVSHSSQGQSKGLMDATIEALFFDNKGMHYAKSYRPFELFVNENYKLRMN